MVVKIIYKILRSIIFSVTLFVVGIYVLAYVLLSIPGFTNLVKNKTADELTALMGGKVEIGSLNIYPFNEVIIRGVSVATPEGEQCLAIERVGAGISVWKLLTQGKIEISYGEIIGLRAEVVQNEKDGPLNIQFIIDAFSKKDEKKEQKAFELALRNVVLRKSGGTFKRNWLGNQMIGALNLADLQVTDLAADITFPKISDKGVEVDLRRLSFSIPGILDIEKIGLKGEFGKEGIFVKNFILELPSSRIHLPEVNIALNDGQNFKDVIFRESHFLEISSSYITPSDFVFLNPILEEFSEPLSLSLQAEGNIENLVVSEFNFGNSDVFLLSLKAQMEGLEDLKSAKGDIRDLDLRITTQTFSRLSGMIQKLPVKIRHSLQNLEQFELNGEFAGNMKNKAIEGNLELHSNLFDIIVEGNFENPKTDLYNLQGEVTIENLLLNEIVADLPLGAINANIVAEATLSKNYQEGMLSLVVDDFEFKGKRYDGFSVNLKKEEETISGDLLVENSIADIVADFEGELEGEEKSARLNMTVERLDLSEIIDMKKYKDYLITGNIEMDGRFEGVDDISGHLNLTNLAFVSPENTRKLKLNQLNILSSVSEDFRSFNIQSDWLDFRAEGEYKITELPIQIRNIAETVFPVFIAGKEVEHPLTSNMEFDLLIKKNNALPEFFNLPVRLLVPVTVSGSLEGTSNSANLTVNIPYLQQGRDKLIYDTKFIADIDGNTGILDAALQTTLPVKKGDLSLDINFFGRKDALSTDIHWINTENSDFKGFLSLDTEFSKNEFTSKPEIILGIQPSVLQMGTAEWNVSKSAIKYKDNAVSVEGLRIWHDDQFVEIEGTASDDYADVVKVSLADIDVDYVFDMLQINYVTFGGTATGEIAGHALLSTDPVAETEWFRIEDFTYNGAPLGTCIATSKWNNEEKEIELSADIKDNGRRIVYGSGGIWLKQDSLCFNISADKVPVDFVQPFMAVFSSHVGGYATGDVKLFGNFHDIDMTGKIFADSVAVKLDYTNTIYHGSDSVLLTPGRIDIPHFMLYDKNGNSALLTGELTHRYFHDPSFTFRLSEAKDFLCYDTSSELNPDWYGTLYGTGSAFLRGVPGVVDISADMTVTGPSVFTFVLNETQYARDYEFLTFSDKKKELAKQDLPLTAEDFKEMLRKKMHEDEMSLSKFGIDIRATVTPQTLFTLVMDPAAGDKITARGKGAMQVKYESDDDEMMMYGKYEIEEGNYNFSLQDIILRDFKIKEGSYISFNGNPLAADLDISATYRVNTNLSDLDKSFSTDRDLNRTNVPVDAVLSVNGNMQSPDITFDIELPTLTQDVERKVKSIISTDDMMNRQIIYLLALNRFYTPEYMGASGNGGELAAVASSTISSQLSNMLGQLTDKVSLSPSFRSDKGDFSDIEVDVALSSRLLNNRLLINGNFGYRDRSNSSTTFVGDFDVEYLLSRNGNLRLKAYNHFNDQNYYLREALTTQGIGVVYRKDFDDWFTFLKKRKRQPAESEDAEEDKQETLNEQTTDGTQD